MERLIVDHRDIPDGYSSVLLTNDCVKIYAPTLHLTDKGMGIVGTL